MAKAIAKSRRGQGSEFGSGRGSEERNSSIPAAGGRGSKRARDNDIEKVRGDSPSHKRSRVKKVPRENQSLDGSLSLLNGNREPYLPQDWNYLKDIPGQRFLDTKHSAGRTPSISDITDNFEDPDETELEDEEDDTQMDDSNAVSTGYAAKGQYDDKLKLGQYIVPQRKAAIKAVSALAATFAQPAPVTTRRAKAKKRKVAFVDDSVTSDSSSSLSEPRKTSKGPTRKVAPASNRRASAAKKARTSDAGTFANSAKRPGQAQKRSVNPQPTNRGRSTSATPLRQIESPASDGLSYTSDEEEIEIRDSQEEDSEDAAVATVKKQLRRSSTPMSPTMSPSKWQISPRKGRMTRAAAAASQFVEDPSNLRAMMPPPARTLRGDPNARTSTSRQPVRPWRIKDVTDYTSADIDHLLARKPPKNGLEFVSHTSLDEENKLRATDSELIGKRSDIKIFHAPLLGGTAYEEHGLIDAEVGLSSSLYEYHYLGSERRLPRQYEEIPSDVHLHFGYKSMTYRRPVGVQQDLFGIDPPGSNTAFDALKFPNRMLLKINANRNAFPQGWNEEALSRIPSDYLMWIHKDLRAKLPYSALCNRDRETLNKVLESLPDNAIFWDQWEQEDAARIIESFTRKVKGRTEHSNNGLLDLAFAASEAAPLPATRVLGNDPPNDFRVEGCRNCAKHGCECDGVKPVCNCCMREGRDCNFSGPDIVKFKEEEVEINESYMRWGSLYDRQHQYANPGAGNLEPILEARTSPIREPSGFDALTLAADIFESGRATRVRGNLAKATKEVTVRVREPGSSPAAPRKQDPLQLHEHARNPGFTPHKVDIVQEGTRTYMIMSSQEESFYARPSIRINVPDHLKNLLVDDWENVTKSLLLVPLPSQAPANFIIDDYFNEEKLNRRLGSAEAEILEEFCAGLKMYFEKAVGKILLYRFERSQLAEVCLTIIPAIFSTNILDS